MRWESWGTAGVLWCGRMGGGAGISGCDALQLMIQRRLAGIYRACQKNNNRTRHPPTACEKERDIKSSKSVAPAQLHAASLTPKPEPIETPRRTRPAHRRSAETKGRQEGRRRKTWQDLQDRMARGRGGGVGVGWGAGREGHGAGYCALVVLPLWWGGDPPPGTRLAGARSWFWVGTLGVGLCAR